MTRRTGGLSILVALAAPLLALGAQTPTPPPPGPIKPASFPPFHETTLPNGMHVLVVQSAKQPVVSLSLSFPAGEMYDPAGKSGLSDMVAGLITKGGGDRSAEAISSAIEGVGGSLAAASSQDFLTIGADVLANDAKLAFSLMADAVMRPTFPGKELELLRTQSLSGLTLELAQPASLATRAFARGLYGDHPYARRSDPASVKAITRADVVKFHHDRVAPSGALLVITGSLSPAEAVGLATSAFGEWKGAPAVVPPPAAPPLRTTTELVLVHRPGSVQSNILVGNLTWKPAYAAQYGITVANRVLGGGANSRLFLILREQKSWTYGAFSTLVTYRDVGNFQANTEVRTEVTDSALVELLAQLRRIRDEPISAKEFDDAKNSLTGAFPLTIESANQVASQVSTARLLGLPSDYVQTYRQKLAAVTVADAHAAAKAGIRPDAALIVVVGDGAKIYDKLSRIAPVKIVAPDGSPLTPADLTVKAAALDLALDRLVARRDSFTIFVQGKPFGSQSSTLEKATAGWRYTEIVQLATFLQQNTEVLFSDKLAMQSVKQSGKVQGQDTKIDVTYADGRAKGKSTTPGPAGVKSIDVDAEVPAGAIDENLITVIASALKWASGAKFTVPIFQSGKGSATNFTLTVSAEESVTVPAGTFETYKVDVTGGEQPSTFWIEKAPSRRVVKLAIVGAPIEMQLVK